MLLGRVVTNLNTICRAVYHHAQDEVVYRLT